MSTKDYRSTYPGSLMFMGEHAVLRGHPAIGLAIDQYLTCELRPRDDRQVFIESDLGETSFSLDNIPIVKPWHFIQTTIKHMAPQIKTGLSLRVSSQFKSTLGFGSSAALTASLVDALHQWLQLPIDQLTLIQKAGKIIHQVQGKASLTDLATSIHGGLIAYCPKTCKIIPLDIQLPLHAIYCGYKTPTPQVIDYVDQKRQKYPRKFKQIDACIAQMVEQTIRACNNHNLVEIGKLMNQHQLCFDKMGICTPEINTILHVLNEDQSILGAKISGSGLGDCVIALGHISDYSKQKISDCIINSQYFLITSGQ